MKHDVKLFYINENDENGWIFLKQFKNEKKMFEYIKKRLKDSGFKSYYMRYWIDGDGSTMVDFGSHSQFFKYKYVEEF